MMRFKNKTGLLYIGQAHHIRLWQPVIQRLQNEGMQLRYVTSHSPFPFETSAQRHAIEPLYYIEDSLCPEDVAQEEQHYQMLCRELAQRQARSPEMRYFSPALTATILRNLVREALLFRRFFAAHPADVVFTLHELNRWGCLFAYLAQEHGIPCITLQEGAYYIKHYSLRQHTCFSMANLLWGQQTRDLLAEMGNDKERMLVVGDTHMDAILPRYQGRQMELQHTLCQQFQLPDQALILVIQGTGLNHPELPIGKIMQSMDFDPALNYLLKMHPTCQRSDVLALQNHFQQHHAHVRIVQDVDAYDLLCAASACITLGLSTLTFEAFAFDKPVLELNIGMPAYYAEQGICPFPAPRELRSVLHSVLHNGLDTAMQQRRSAWCQRVFHHPPEGVQEHVVRVIDYLLHHHTLPPHNADGLIDLPEYAA